MTTEVIAALAREKIAPRFAQALAEARRRLEQAHRELDDLTLARGTIEWEVQGVGSVFLNVSDGCMAAEGAPLEAPFMTISQSREDWQRFSAGTVSTGFMGGSRQNLGQSRIQRLKGLKGTVRFVMTGLPDGDWSSIIRFGPGPHAPEPQTTIRIPAEVAQKVQKGELNPQMAFMQGHIRIEGDAGLAMQVGMAMTM